VGSVCLRVGQRETSRGKSVYIKSTLALGVLKRDLI
jgi:hypothetical protein